MDKFVLILLSLVVISAVVFVIWYNSPDAPAPVTTPVKAAVTANAVNNTNPLANLVANNLTAAQVTTIANSVLGGTVSNTNTAIATDPGTVTGVSAGTTTTN